MWKRDCLCGHMWATHGYRKPDDTRCCAPGCACIYYAPRGPRWWRRATQTPAGDEPPPVPPGGAGRPLPGPAVYTGTRPRIGYRVVADFARDCPCQFIWDSRTRRITTHPCDGHTFDLDAWEKKVTP